MLKSLVVKMLAGVGICMLMLVIFLGPGAFSADACGTCDTDIGACQFQPPPQCEPGLCRSLLGLLCNNCTCLLRLDGTACSCR